MENIIKDEFTNLMDEMDLDNKKSNPNQQNSTTQTRYNNNNFGKIKKYSYITILKQWVVFEKTSYNKETKTRTTVVLVDKILPLKYKFWINGNNMYPNQFYQTDIISCSIDLNDDNLMFITQEFGEKEKKTITREKFINYWKAFIEPKIEQYKALGNQYLESEDVASLFSNQISQTSKNLGIESFKNLLDKEIARENYKKEEVKAKPAEDL